MCIERGTVQYGHTDINVAAVTHVTNLERSVRGTVSVSRCHIFISRDCREPSRRQNEPAGGLEIVSAVLAERGYEDTREADAAAVSRGNGLHTAQV